MTIRTLTMSLGSKSQWVVVLANLCGPEAKNLESLCFVYDACWSKILNFNLTGCRRIRDSNKMVPLLTLLMSLWPGSVKSFGSVSLTAKLK